MNLSMCSSRKPIALLTKAHLSAQFHHCRSQTRRAQVQLLSRQIHTAFPLLARLEAHCSFSSSVSLLLFGPRSPQSRLLTHTQPALFSRSRHTGAQFHHRLPGAPAVFSFTHSPQNRLAPPFSFTSFSRPLPLSALGGDYCPERGRKKKNLSVHHQCTNK